MKHTDNIAAVASLPSGLKPGTTYKIRSCAFADSYMLNVNGGSDSNHAPVNMWSPDIDINRKGQKFWLISSGSYYKLGAVCSTNGRVLDAYRYSDGSLKDGCNVDIWNSNNDDAQELTISGNNTSGYVIRLAHHQDLALTAVSPSNGGAVQFNTYTDASNQKW